MVVHTLTVRRLLDPGAMGIRITIAESEWEMATAKKSTEIQKPSEVFSTDELAALSSFEEALTLVSNKIGEQNLALADQEIGDGFKLLENKDQLIGIPFLAVGWSFHPGEHGEFVAVKLMTKTGDKFILNDGGSGICDQLRTYSEKKGIQAGLMCAKGLRRSDYEYEEKDTGEKKKAKTYYIDTSA